MLKSETAVPTLKKASATVKTIRRIKKASTAETNKEPIPADTVPSIAHLAGVWKDDPTWDEFMAIIQENRRLVNALYAEDETTSDKGEVERTQD